LHFIEHTLFQVYGSYFGRLSSPGTASSAPAWPHPLIY
jgi:hypothetical protein